MTKFGNNVLAVLILSAVAAMLPGCQKPEGPMEKMGKSIDKAVDRAADSVERAGDNIKDDAKK
jgi:ABC-type uncharacterized transport system auxiliary subunit